MNFQQTSCTCFTYNLLKGILSSQKKRKAQRVRHVSASETTGNKDTECGVCDADVALK